MDVVSISPRTRTYPQALNNTIVNAYNTGIFLVAAGNSEDENLSTDNVIYPAKFNSMVAVSATIMITLRRFGMPK